MLFIMLLSYCQFVSVVDVHVEHCQSNCCEPKALNTRCLFTLEIKLHCFWGATNHSKVILYDEGLKERQDELIGSIKTQYNINMDYFELWMKATLVASKNKRIRL